MAFSFASAFHFFLDYIGCLTRVNDVQTLGNANTSQTVIRILDIKNLNGDVVELTLRDEIARTLAKDVYDQIERLVFIAVSFCELSKYKGLQLSATLATYYYLNPYILDIEAIRDQVNGSQEESERSQRAAIEKQVCIVNTTATESRWVQGRLIRRKAVEPSLSSFEKGQQSIQRYPLSRGRSSRVIRCRAVEPCLSSFEKRQQSTQRYPL
ncbi:nucleic acid-binding, OB-fold protein [Tanacetum coccineum]